MQGSAAVGTYGVAYKVMENLTFFPALLAGLILPLLSRAFSSDGARFREIADSTFRVFTIIAIPIVLGGVFFAEPVIMIVSGSGFQDSVPVLRLLIVSLAFIFSEVFQHVAHRWEPSESPDEGPACHSNREYFHEPDPYPEVFVSRRGDDIACDGSARGPFDRFVGIPNASVPAFHSKRYEDSAVDGYHGGDPVVYASVPVCRFRISFRVCLLGVPLVSESRIECRGCWFVLEALGKGISPRGRGVVGSRTSTRPGAVRFGFFNRKECRLMFSEPSWDRVVDTSGFHRSSVSPISAVRLRRFLRKERSRGIMMI